jgi:hypothetical protein
MPGQRLAYPSRTATRQVYHSRHFHSSKITESSPCLSSILKYVIGTIIAIYNNESQTGARNPENRFGPSTVDLFPFLQCDMRTHGVRMTYTFFAMRLKHLEANKVYEVLQTENYACPEGIETPQSRQCFLRSTCLAEHLASHYNHIWGVGALLLEVIWMRLSCNANLTGVKKCYFALGSDQRHMGGACRPNK